MEPISQRHWKIQDGPTVFNLRVLEHLSKQDCKSGDFLLCDSLVIAAIRSLDILPSAVKRHFEVSSFYIGGDHARSSDEGRRSLWKALADKLSQGLDRVAGDSSLMSDAADFSDRKRTMGEKIESLCVEINSGISNGQSVEGLVSRLEYVSAGTEVAYDARALGKLLRQKHYSHSKMAQIHRLIEHAKICADNLHHRT